jgi:hypothetical protein
MLKANSTAGARPQQRGNGFEHCSLIRCDELLRGGFFVQRGTHGQGGVGIDGAVAFVDQLNDALFVDDDIRTQSPLVRFILDVVALEDAVGLEHFAIHITEQWEGDADLLGERGVGRGTI